MYSQFICMLQLVYMIQQTSVNAKLNLSSWNDSHSRQIQHKCDFTTQSQCSSDCSSILMCSAGNEIPTNSTKCPQDAPYCEKGICSSFPGNCFVKKSMSHVCTGEGIFPEPTDCTRYYYCSNANSSSIQYECPRGYIYNSKLKICQKGVPRGIHASRKICEKITCNFIQNEFILFPANPTYYAFCYISASGIHRIFMYKCENDESYFDIKTRKCSFNCKSAGYFPDSTNCSAYYICDGQKKYLARRVSCPPGYYFNGTACINSATHCPPGTVIVDTTISTLTQPPIQTHTPSTHSPTVVSEPSTESPSEILQVTPSAITATTESPIMVSIQPSTQLSTDSITEEEQEPFEPTLIIPYPSILYLPCPMWIQNQQICGRGLD